jgi:hypothetical protein
MKPLTLGYGPHAPCKGCAERNLTRTPGSRQGAEEQGSVSNSARVSLQPSPMRPSCRTDRPARALSGPLPYVTPTQDLFRLAAIGHASAVDISSHIAPEVLRIFPGLGVAILKRLCPGGAGAIASLGEARGYRSCNDKSKCKRSQLHDHGCLLADSLPDLARNVA